MSGSKVQAKMGPLWRTAECRVLGQQHSDEGNMRTERKTGAGEEMAKCGVLGRSTTSGTVTKAI